MALQNNILSFDGSRALDRQFVLREGHRKTVELCRQFLFNTAPMLMEEMFGKLDDALYELADRADNNSLQSAYFDAMREVRKDRERIEDGFKANVVGNYDRFWNSGPTVSRAGNPPGELNADEFALVENEDLEEGLAFNNMISRGENRHYQQLYGLNKRLSHLIGGLEVDQTNNPLAPAAICEAFHQVAKGLVLEVPVKLVIYKQFERNVIDSLDALYVEINGILAQAGVLPRLTRKMGRAANPQSSLSGGKASDGAHNEFGDSGYDEEEENLQAELFATLQQLLGQKRPALSPAVMARKARMPVVDTSDVIAALSSLQQASMAESSYETPVGDSGTDLRLSLLRTVQNSQRDHQAKQISQNDEDAIDVISMLFEFILEDRNLADAMKALLAQLQIPMLKVAIMDKSFFSKKTHPARRLLNNLAQAAIGWTETHGRDDGGLYAQIESIVERIRTRFEKDIELFVGLNNEFTAFLEQEEQRSTALEQRAAQVTEGKEQLQNARHRVFEEINNRLFSRSSVPEVVVTLLKDGWKDVLLLICLRQGFDSPEWQEALDLMDQLLWSIEPKAEKIQRQALLKEIPILLKGLRNGLNSITYDQHKMTRLFKELQACHVDCLKGKGAPLVVTTFDPGSEPSAEATGRGAGAAGQFAGTGTRSSAGTGAMSNIVLESSTANGSSAAAQRDQFLELAQKLETGTWLEINEDNETRLRAKLSWRSRISGTCLFVNRKGMKVAELTLQGLAAWFRNGKAVVLENAEIPLMDRALVAMVDVLKDGDGQQEDQS